MRYKKEIQIYLIWLVFLLFWWENININSKSISSDSELSNLLNLNAGFNYIILHGTLYSIMFFLLIYNLLKDESFIIIKYSRATYFLSKTKKAIILSCVFAFSFVLIETICVVKYVNLSLLLQTAFFIRQLIIWLMFTFLYYFMTLILNFIHLLIYKKNITIILSIAITTILVVLSYYFHLKLPFSDIMCINEFMSMHKLNLAKLILLLLKNTCFIIVINTILYELFKKRDLINEED